MDKNGDIQFKRILNILKGKELLIVLILLVFVVFGYIYSYYYVIPEYKVSETLLLIPNNTSEKKVITSTDLTLNSELIATYSNIAKQSIILKQVIENLDLNMTETELLNKLKVSNIDDTYVIEIIVTDKNPEMATNIAKELSNVFLKEIKEIYNLENIGIIDEAELPREPYNINHLKDLSMSCIIRNSIFMYSNDDYISF